VLAAVVVLLVSVSAFGADSHPAPGRHFQRPGGRHSQQAGGPPSQHVAVRHSQPAELPRRTGGRSVHVRLPIAVVKVPGPTAPISVPRSFLGLSTEYWTIPVWAKHLSVLGRVLSTITPHGPMVLRIGGSSADQAFWAPSKEPPEWVFGIRRSWLNEVRRIVNRFRVRVILDLNLVTATPQIAVRWARAAETALPAESIVGFEIGNESDIYSRASWNRLTNGLSPITLPQRMTAAGYAGSYLTYAKALALVDRHIPLLGPALSNPAAHLSWISRLVAGPHPGLGAITVHRYPLSACSHRGSKTFPTIRRVLSERASAGMARTIRGAVQTAQRAGLPVRLTELNSVTCGGRKGVSNTFATALWAPDALFELLRAGASSAAVHVRANAINMAFSLTHRGLVANPLLYGLSLFSRTLGAGTHLLPLRTIARPPLRLKAWAVRTQGNTLHVLLIDKDTRGARVSLQIPGAGPARVQRLLAPSARATSGVTLGGQHLDAQGRWAGKASVETIHPGRHGYQVNVPGISAALVTVTLKRGAL
jgi:Glycosyl hydrolase family 79 C-terminal beta domain